MDQLDFLNPEDQARVTTWREQWDKVLRDGVIVDLTIRQWQPYARLTTERLAQIGARFDSDEAIKAMDEVVRAGSIDLIPKELRCAIRNSANKARDILRVSTYGVMWGRLLPAAAYEAWRETTAQLETDFWTNVADLTTNLPAHLEEMRATYTALYSESYDKLERLGQVEVSKEEFVTAVVEGLIAQVPSAETIRSKYSWGLNFKFAPMSDEIAAAEAKAVEIRAESLVSQESLSAERKSILASMQRDVASSLERQRASIEESLGEAEAEFYRTLKKTAADVAEKLNGCGTIGGRSSVGLRTLIGQIRALNVFDDEGLDAQADALEAALDVRQGGRVAGRKEALEDLRTGLAALETYGTQALEAIPTKRGVRVVQPMAPAQLPAISRTARKIAVAPTAIDGPVTTTRRRRREV